MIEAYTRAPRVVLVDDDEGTLDILPRFFSREGIESRIAATGAQALRLLRAQRFDAVVLDLCLPDMSGLTVLSELRHMSDRVPVVMVSGFATVEDATAAMRLGASDVLTKPLDADKLVTLVRSLVSPASAGPADEDAADTGPAAPTSSATAGIRDENLFRMAQSAIRAHLGQAELSLGAVASLLDMFRWRLSRAFSACGSDFRGCVRRVRMREAGSRLRDPHTASVKEVAFDVGYRHHSDFTRHFKPTGG